MLALAAGWPVPPMARTHRAGTLPGWLAATEVLFGTAGL
jgi:hypothetical protein